MGEEGHRGIVRADVMRSHPALVGERFGKLVVIAENPNRKGAYGRIWLCRCDCGNYIELSSARLRGGEKLACSLYDEINGKQCQVAGKSRRVNWRVPMFRLYGEPISAYELADITNYSRQAVLGFLLSGLTPEEVVVKSRTHRELLLRRHLGRIKP